MSKFAVIIAAAGRSSRFKDEHYKKPFANLAGRAVWLHSAERFLNRDDCCQVLLVIAPADREAFDTKFSANVAILGVDVVEGGNERADSIQNALARVNPAADYIAVHDAARPLLADEWIDRLFDAAKKTGAAILAVPVSSTLKRVGKNQQIEQTVSRTNLWEAQTPQAFRYELLMEAYAQRDDLPATDDAQLVERFGHAVTVVMGSPINLKITTKKDLHLAEHAIKALPKPKLEGFSHPFQDDNMWR